MLMFLLNLHQFNLDDWGKCKMIIMKIW